ncbi:MAG: ABC transporter substrate-binding protein [Treponema sp.]|jgi:putative aldouronate transport system substrate-binding protein|nr:ABC transporter substrate-binding protein [Treponema sp.]
MKKNLLVTAAALAALLASALPLFAGGGGQSGASAAKPYEIVWYVGGPGPQTDTPAVLAEVNKYLAGAGVNATLKIVETDFGSYNQKMQMVIASQEPYDLCYTASWINNYTDNVAKNAFLPLDDLLPQYAAQLWKDIPVGGWDACRIKGKIYGVPNQQIWAYTKGVDIVRSWLDKYGYTKDSIKTVADLEGFMAKVKKDNPNMYPFVASRGGVNNNLLDPVDIIVANVGYYLTDNSLKIQNIMETPEMVVQMKRNRDWYLKGYVRPDVATLTDNARNDLLSGLSIAGWTGNVKPSDESEMYAQYGFEFSMIPLSRSWLTTSGITATITAVSQQSKNPEAVVQLLNLVNTDKAFYTLITRGIEGKHYRKTDANYVEIIPNSGYAPNADWMYGSVFNSYLLPGQDLTVWEDTIKMNNNATPSPLIGFVLDPTPIQTEIANVTAVWEECIGLADGSADFDTAYPAYLAANKAAGVDKIITEIQRQVDEWKRTK